MTISNVLAIRIRNSARRALAALGTKASESLLLEATFDHLDVPDADLDLAIGIAKEAMKREREAIPERLARAAERTAKMHEALAKDYAERLFPKAAVRELLVAAEQRKYAYELAPSKHRALRERATWDAFDRLVKRFPNATADKETTDGV